MPPDEARGQDRRHSPQHQVAHAPSALNKGAGEAGSASEQRKSCVSTERIESRRVRQADEECSGQLLDKRRMRVGTGTMDAYQDRDRVLSERRSDIIQDQGKRADDNAEQQANASPPP